jgi:hypothetical protein
MQSGFNAFFCELARAFSFKYEGIPFLGQRSNCQRTVVRHRKNRDHGEKLIKQISRLNNSKARRLYPAFAGRPADFCDRHRDSDIAISSLSEIAGGCDGESRG